MLKKDYDSFYTELLSWIFNKYLEFAVSRKFGETSIKDMPSKQSLMQVEVLTFVSNANKRRNPNSPLLIPACIDPKDLNVIMSTVKNNYL
jgi:hypothetical protein